MKVYKIYANTQGHYKAVKQGWSWPAFGFSCVWAMVNRIWRMSSVSVSLFFIIGFSSLIVLAIPAEMMARFSNDLLVIYGIYFVLGIQLLMGFNGNAWYERSLVIKGYTCQELVIANNEQDAIALHQQQSNEHDLLLA